MSINDSNSGDNRSEAGAGWRIPDFVQATFQSVEEKFNPATRNIALLSIPMLSYVVRMLSE